MRTVHYAAVRKRVEDVKLRDVKVVVAAEAGRSVG